MVNLPALRSFSVAGSNHSDAAISIIGEGIPTRLLRPSGEGLAMTADDVLKFVKPKEALCQKQR